MSESVLKRIEGTGSFKPTPEQARTIRVLESLTTYLGQPPYDFGYGISQQLTRKRPEGSTIRLYWHAAPEYSWTHPMVSVELDGTVIS